ncbi:uncharacterized protein [Rutidosis leptorrhynchoides]|uniref:uncharacterized protein n=1 Tax=Rutidosis leptorrhynchoides TaxID=125765 RepID=UPI003A98F879
MMMRRTPSTSTIVATHQLHHFHHRRRSAPPPPLPPSSHKAIQIGDDITSISVKIPFTDLNKPRSKHSLFHSLTTHGLPPLCRQRLKVHDDTSLWWFNQMLLFIVFLSLIFHIEKIGGNDEK